MIGTKPVSFQSLNENKIQWKEAGGRHLDRRPRIVSKRETNESKPSLFKEWAVIRPALSAFAVSLLDFMASWVLGLE